MTRSYIALFLLVVCASSAGAQDVVTLPPQCSDEAPRWTGPAPQLPVVATPKPGTGSIIGTARVRGAKQRLSGGNVRATPAKQLQSQAQLRETNVDSLGGFALTNLTPGKYKLLVRSVGYHFTERTIEVRADRVDTLNAELAYLNCSGY
jgi:hypothetical protein